jgi:hypothetical protein
MAFVTAKNSSAPRITCQSAFRPMSFISGTSVPRISATPPPNAVALTCSTRASRRRPASSRISSVRCAPMIGRYSSMLFGVVGTELSTAYPRS